MKRIQKILLTAMLMAGLGFGLSACVGYVDDGPGYYGHDHWYHDGPWMGGPRGYVGVGVHARRW
jgi:hypothetical protein